MAALLPDVDPHGLLEYSAVFTDRSLNHMSQTFQQVMTDISAILKKAYHAQSAIIVPGGGTYSMEAVARQFGTNKKCLVLRNGWFSYRWTQIFNMGSIPSESLVLKARPVNGSKHAPYIPAPIEEVVATIEAEKPDFVFAPHVETSSGIILPDDYIRAVADAVHSVGGLVVLDCVASGTIWVDMEECGVDILISAPQKGWSSSPCGGLVMLNAAASKKIKETTSTSFACDLRKWLEIMEAYENGGFGYHATMPTDSLRTLRDMMKVTQEYGFKKAKSNQQALGDRVRTIFAEKGFKSLAADGFLAPSVVVYFTNDVAMQNGKKFSEVGLQIAAGIPLQCNEPKDFKTFRLGLLGLDKLQNIDRTVENLDKALNRIE